MNKTNFWTLFLSVFVQESWNICAWAPTAEHVIKLVLMLCNYASWKYRKLVSVAVWMPDITQSHMSTLYDTRFEMFHFSVDKKKKKTSVNEEWLNLQNKGFVTIKGCISSVAVQGVLWREMKSSLCTTLIMLLFVYLCNCQHEYFQLCAVTLLNWT